LFLVLPNRNCTGRVRGDYEPGNQIKKFVKLVRSNRFQVARWGKLDIIVVIERVLALEEG
jgi:hypothetical protein